MSGARIGVRAAISPVIIMDMVSRPYLYGGLGSFNKRFQRPLRAWVVLCCLLDN